MNRGSRWLLAQQIETMMCWEVKAPSVDGFENLAPPTQDFALQGAMAHVKAAELDPSWNLL